MTGRMPAWVKSLTLLTYSAFGTPPAMAGPADLCFQSGTKAAAAHGVPPAVMTAITLTETGRGTPSRPWPWTINLAGEGHWFDTRAEAIAFARNATAAGRRNFDVGCFQLNYRWHGAAFASIEQMFDPQANADYAARFIADIYPETRDWSVAAGTYHSRTAVHATRYRAIFDRHLASLGTRATTTLARVAPGPRVNTFPLIQRPTTPPRLGSLVSLGADG